jgi:protein-S-isoprenylcysteine O-methyltransferase Ste14
VRKLTKLRFLLAWPLVVWMLLTARTTEFLLSVGTGLALLGELMRLWANGYVGHVKVNWTQKWRGDSKIGRMITAGPYAFVRHPLYLGTFFIGAGFCLIAGSPWVGAAALAFFLIIYRRKMIQEEALLQGELGAPYADYRAAVPKWVPTGRRYADRQGRWSWQGIAASKEWKTGIWVVVLLVALYLRQAFLRERELFPPDRWLQHAVLLGTAAVLVLTDGIAELTLRRRRRAKPTTLGAE